MYLDKKGHSLFSPGYEQPRGPLCKSVGKKEELVLAAAENR